MVRVQARPRRRARDRERRSFLERHAVGQADGFLLVADKVLRRYAIDAAPQAALQAPERHVFFIVVTLGKDGNDPVADLEGSNVRTDSLDYACAVCTISTDTSSGEKGTPEMGTTFSGTSCGAG